MPTTRRTAHHQAINDSSFESRPSVHKTDQATDTIIKTTIMMMTRIWSLLYLLLGLAAVVEAQQAGYDGGYYEQDSYAQDNLYHDYAARQAEKDHGAVAGGPGWGKLAAAAGAGWFIGSKFHCRRQKKKLDTKFKADQKTLYQQYYEDVYSLQLQNAELISALEQLGYKVTN